MAGKNYSFHLTIQGPADYSARYDIPIGITTIGRDADNVLRLNDRSVSRHHARLECIAGECEIIDLESSNGVFVNGNKIPARKPTRLNEGDRIKVGPHFEMIFSQEEVAIESSPVEEAELAEKLPISPAEPMPILHAESQAPGILIPPTAPPPPDDLPPTFYPNGFGELPPGLSTESYRLINYLPGIYHDNRFLKQFLAIFEAILFPIEWNIDNFDLFLSPKTAPSSFLPWLANWFGGEFDSTWTEAQRRAFLAEAHALYARRGTKWALSRVLELYTGLAPDIDDLAEDLRPHFFRIQLAVPENVVNRPSLEALINHFKPAHTDYELSFQV